MEKKGRVRNGIWWALAGVPVAWAVSAALGWTLFLDDQILSGLLRVRGEIDAPVNVVYVDVDSRATGAFGSQPWHRGIFAVLAEGLLEHGGAKAVGFDFVFSEYGHAAAREGNAELRRVSERFPGRLVLAAAYVTELGAVREDRSFPLRYLGFRDPEANDLPELPEFAAAGFDARVGLIDVIERAGRPHVAPMFAEARGTRYLQFGLQLALLHWGLDADAVHIHPSYRAIEILDTSGERVARIPLVREQFVEINWHSRWISEKNPRWSVADVAYHLGRLKGGSPEQQEEAREFLAQFQDAIVLVGPVDPLLGDRATTPFDPRGTVPKVGAHGNLVKTIVGGNFLPRLPSVWEGGLIFLLGALVIPAMRCGGRMGKIFGMAAGALSILYFAGAVWMFAAHHWVLPWAAPFLAVVTTGSIGAVVRWKAAEQQRKRIEGLFGAYLAPEMVKILVGANEEPRLGGEEVEITAYFSDIEGFSSFSETLPATDLVSLMNEYLTALTDVLLEEGATLDKYIGDAVVAFFGSPVRLENHAWLACRSAVRVQEQQEILRRKWLSEKGRWPDRVTRMRTRIGLSSGLAVTGNMGSERRFNYTMMGDTVNVGARLEQLGKTMGALILVTGETRRRAERSGPDFLFRSLGPVLVSGRVQEVEVHELLGLKEEASEGLRDCIHIFEQGLEHYQDRRWKEAERIFLRAQKLEPGHGGEKTPSSVFLANCRERMK